MFRHVCVISKIETKKNEEDEHEEKKNKKNKTEKDGDRHRQETRNKKLMTCRNRQSETGFCVYPPVPWRIQS